MLLYIRKAPFENTFLQAYALIDMKYVCHVIFIYWNKSKGPVLATDMHHNYNTMFNV